jgi:serine kinase of HPr protein (carbohydrate metabolism regulator)
MADQVDIHGTAIAVGDRSVLIRGRSGAGKSDLALRCLAVPVGYFVASPPRLVADDRVMVVAGPAGVLVSAPAPLRGLLEVRGVGIIRVPTVDNARLALVADIVAPEEIERLPGLLPSADICGTAVPRMLIAPFEVSAPLKLLLALAATMAPPERGCGGA